MSKLVKQATEMRDLLLTAFAKAFPEEELEVREVPVNDLVVSMPAALVLPAVRVLAEELGIVHLSTITGDDGGDHVRLLYHFWHGSGVTLEAKVPVPEPHVATLTEQIPGATFYEREIFEMFGVVFDGHPDLRPLLLPEDWEGGPPMLKSSDSETEPKA
jgi:NADH:ubiquinone oxidoreductase subunit C